MRCVWVCVFCGKMNSIKDFLLTDRLGKKFVLQILMCVHDFTESTEILQTAFCWPNNFILSSIPQWSLTFKSVGLINQRFLISLYYNMEQKENMKMILKQKKRIVWEDKSIHEVREDKWNLDIKT